MVHPQNPRSSTSSNSSASAQPLPIARNRHRILAEEFDSVDADFRASIRRMEREMDEFWSRPSHQLFRQAASMPAIAGNAGGGQQLARATSGALPAASSALVQNLGDSHHLLLRFDVRQYAPEEVEVRIEDGCLRVLATHEERTPNRSVFRQYKQEYQLPPHVDAEALQTTLSADGILAVEAPLLELETDGRGQDAIATNHSHRSGGN